MPGTCKCRHTTRNGPRRKPWTAETSAAEPDVDFGGLLEQSAFDTSLEPEQEEESTPFEIGGLIPSSGFEIAIEP